MRYVVGVGASGAQAEERVREGIARLRELPPGILRVVSASSAYANPAFGGVTHDRFVNAAVVVESALAAAALLHSLHAVERALGRVRGAKNGARALDLDVLLALDAAAPLSLVVGAPAAVPHPRLAERPSALVPTIEAIERAGVCAGSAALAVPAWLRIAADSALRATLLSLDNPDGVHSFSQAAPRR